MSVPGYVVGLCRNEPDSRKAHLYKGTHADPGEPMCVYGWNRDNGFGYSILRGNVGPRGVCAICVKRARAGLEPVPPKERKTRWL